MRISQLFAGPYDDGPRARLFARLTSAFALPDELRQQLVLAQRPGWQALAEHGRPAVALPFRRWPEGRLLDPAWLDPAWFDRRGRRALADELALFKPDVIAVWDAAAMARLPEELPDDCVTLGIATDLESAVALRRCRYLVATAPAIAEQAVARGWPEERVRRLPAFASGDLEQPLPRASLATSDQATVVLLPFALPGEALGEVLTAARRLPLPTLWMPGVTRRLLKLAVQSQVPLRDLSAGFEPARALAACDLVLDCAEADAPGLGIVEGWAQSKPVVAAGPPAASGLIRDGETGILARDGSAAALAAALRRPLDDPLLYDRLAAGGRATFDSGHAEARSLARWLETFVRLGGLMLPESRAARRARTPQPAVHTDIQI